MRPDDNPICSISGRRSHKRFRNQKWRIEKDRREGRYYIPVNHMLGYRYDSKKNIVIQEDEANIIRLIYKLYLEDMGTTAIADFLMKEGVKNRHGLVS